MYQELICLYDQLLSHIKYVRKYKTHEEYCNYNRDICYKFNEFIRSNKLTIEEYDNECYTINISLLLISLLYSDNISLAKYIESKGDFDHTLLNDIINEPNIIRNETYDYLQYLSSI